MRKEQIIMFLRINFALSNVLVMFMDFFQIYNIFWPPVRKPPENGLCMEIYPIYLKNSETRINML